MSWMEFISRLSDAWAWPLVAGWSIFLLRKQIKTAADKLVERIGEIARLAFPGGAIDFRGEVEKLAKDTEELESEAPKALPAGQPKEVVLPPETADERLTKYQQIAALDPRAAILLPFADMESAIRKRFYTLYPHERRPVSFLRVIDKLQSERRLDPEVANALRQMNKIKNDAAHESTRVDPEVANSFLESVGNVLGYLLLFDFFDDPEPTP